MNPIHDLPETTTCPLPTRRQWLLRALSAGGAATLASVTLGGCGGDNNNNASTGGSIGRDIDILNFALNLVLC